VTSGDLLLYVEGICRNRSKIFRSQSTRCLDAQGIRLPNSESWVRKPFEVWLFVRVHFMMTWW